MSPCIYCLIAFSFPSMSRANLGPSSTFTKATLWNLGKEGSPSSLDLHIPAQHWPPGLFCAFLEDSGCLAQEIAQMCPWANSSSELELCNAQSQQSTTRMDYALHSSSSQPFSQQPHCALCSFGSRYPDLLTEITQPSWSFTQVCCNSILMFILVFD